MRRQRFVAVLVGVMTLAGAFLAASPAAASTTQPVKMTFTEPAVNKDCTVTDGFCGSGWVIPLGFATETIEFNAGCGGTCDLRTINLAGGSILIEETFSNPQCPSCHGTPADVTSGTLTDVIIGGTGTFVGATGTLSGTVRAAGLTSQIKLSGTITFGP